MSNPLISIVVPAYNVGKYIHQCIKSVINQSYSNWELLLIVGGADDTVEICDQYAAKDIRIKSIHDNKGLVPARNVGFSSATGEWITYLDGDDWLDIDTCEVLVGYINKLPDLDIIYWRYIEELEAKSIDKWSQDSVKMKLYTCEDCKDLARKVLIYKYGISDGVCKLINMKYAKQYGIYHDIRLMQGSEGVEFALRAFYNAKKVLYLNKCFYHYRYTTNSISKRVDEGNTKYLLDCYKIILDDINKFENKDLFLNAFYERTCYMLIAIAMNTYFSPFNNNSLKVKISHYADVIESNIIFKEAIESASTDNLDVFRKITLFLIRKHMYFFLDPIARVKQLMLKFGFYNY